MASSHPGSKTALSGTTIPPGGAADYDFPLTCGGTFWMHSHYGLQEQLLMSAPLIIHDARDKADQQEVIISRTRRVARFALKRDFRTRGR